MIIIVNPMLSNSQINSDSNYVYLRQILTEMIPMRPDWIYLMLWPTGTDFKYYDDGFFKKYKNNILRIPKKWQSGKYRAGSDYDVNFFYELMTKYPHNLIWNNTVEQTPIFFNVTPQSSESFRPIIVNYHHFPVHPTLPGISKQYIGVQALQAIGTFLADLNVFNSKHCQFMAREVNEQFFGPKQLQKIEENSFLNYMGPIERNFPETTNYDRPVFLYNHRIAGYKNWDVTFDFFNKFADRGLDFDVLVTCVDTQMVSRVGNRKYVKSFNAFTREQYLELLPKANLNVSNSQHETFCIAMVESMGAGHACLAPNGITFPELFNNGQAGLLFNSENEQYHLMEKLITDKSFRQEWGEKAKLRAQSFFSAERYAIQAFEAFDKVAASRLRLPDSGKKIELERAIKKISKNEQIMKAYRFVQKEVGWMDQAFPMRYFTLACQKYGRKFKISGNQIIIGE